MSKNESPVLDVDRSDADSAGAQQPPASSTSHTADHDVTAELPPVATSQVTEELPEQASEQTTDALPRTAEQSVKTPVPPQPSPVRLAYREYIPVQIEEGLRFSLPHQREFSRLFAALFISALLLGAGFSSVLSYMGTFKETRNHALPVGTRPKLVVSNDHGNIHIVGQKHGPYGVQEKRSASGMGLGRDSFSVYYNQIGNTFEVSARVMKDALFMGTKMVDLEITVPIATEVSAYTGQGNIEMSAIQGNVTAESGAGSIQVRDSSGKFSLKTTTGTIMLNHFQGQLSSSIENGNMTLTQASLMGKSALKVTSGMLKFAGSLDVKGFYRFETLNGPIDITLPSTSAFKLNVTSDLNRVNNEFGRFVNGSTLQAAVTVSTLNDAVYIRKTIAPSR